jgi:hypothetical protein
MPKLPPDTCQLSLGFQGQTSAGSRLQGIGWRRTAVNIHPRTTTLREAKPNGDVITTVGGSSSGGGLCRYSLVYAFAVSRFTTISEIDASSNLTSHGEISPQSRITADSNGVSSDESDNLPHISSTNDLYSVFAEMCRISPWLSKHDVLAVQMRQGSQVKKKLTPVPIQPLF